ncbi:MAG TPA: hypothetical protein VMC85_06870 [Desulfomonilaceae bacterium]|nr:hypothetical protein [Desulfomonilaceae bacterium]
MRNSSKIFVLHASNDDYAAEIVAAGMRRSFTGRQVEKALWDCLTLKTAGVVMINPTDRQAPLLRDTLDSGGKVVILGRVSDAIADCLGLVVRSDDHPDPDWAMASVAPSEPYNASPVVVRYVSEHVLGRAAVVVRRPLRRYDYEDEWNNLGYGPILCDDSPWAVSSIVDCNTVTCFGFLEDQYGKKLSAYAAIIDGPRGAALWINRAVGPIDSVEWCIVEEFFGSYRCDELACYPYLNEIPLGYSGGVTMRLDCDQGVASAQMLFDLYSGLEIPFSVAISTGMEMTREDLKLLTKIVAKRGAVVSHSVNHFPNWGGSYDVAREEARNSRAWIETNLPDAGLTVYAVSPFHQNPLFAVQALAETGYKGFVGGSIRNDPEFLLGRAGRVPFIDPPIVSHSQQCMLHGDCFQRYGSSVDTYVESFMLHTQGGAIFGYLDHPFGPDYTYGWASEEKRLAVHEEFLSHLLSLDGLWWGSLVACMDFLVTLGSANLWIDEPDRVRIDCDHSGSSLMLSATWKGKIIAP